MFLSNQQLIEPQNFSENIGKDEKIEKLKLIAKETVDIRGIGLYTLGSARKSLTEEEKSIYAIRFEKNF